ncbi:TonB-copper family protein [Fulvitalea axinellae]
MRKTFLFIIAFSLFSHFVLAQADTLFLNEIVVTGNADKGFEKKHSLSNIDDILSRSSNIGLVRRGNYAAEPRMLGFSGGQIMTTVAGMKIFGACTDKMDPVSSYVETANLRSVNATSSDSSAENACVAGGSLDFCLHEANYNESKTFSGNFGTGYFSASQGKEAFGVLDYSGDKLALRYSGSYRAHDNYRAGGGDKVSFSHYNKTNHLISGKYKLNDRNWVTADVLYDRAWDVGYPALPMDVSLAEAFLFGAAYNITPRNSDIENIEWKVYANKVKHIMDDSERPDVPVRMDMPGETRTYGTYLKISGQKKKHGFTAKADFYNSLHKAEMTMYPPENNGPEMYMETWPDVFRNNMAIYIGDRFAFADNFTLNTDARIEFARSNPGSEFGKKQFEIFGNEINADNRLLYSFASDIKNNIGDMAHALGISISERQPTVSEQYGFYLFNSEDGYDYVGRPDIDNEQTFKAQYVVEYNTTKLSVKTETYFAWLRDYISGVIDPNLDRMTIGAKGVKVFRNRENARQYGANVYATYSLAKYWSARTNLRYTAGQYQDDNDNWQNMPQLLPLNGNVSLSFQKEKLSLTAESEFATAQNQTDPNFGESETAGYAIANLRGAYSFGKKNTYNIEAGIENILDKKYRSHLDWGGIPRPGRNVYLTLNLAF